LVWLRFGLAKFGSQINGLGHIDAACKISAQLDLIGLAKFGSKINGIRFSEAECKILAQSDLIWLSYS
jgi:hypothetical protein